MRSSLPCILIMCGLLSENRQENTGDINLVAKDGVVPNESGVNLYLIHQPDFAHDCPPCTEIVFLLFAAGPVIFFEGAFP